MTKKTYRYRVTGSRGAVYETTTLKEAQRIAGKRGVIEEIGRRRGNPAGGFQPGETVYAVDSGTKYTVVGDTGDGRVHVTIPGYHMGANRPPSELSRTPPRAQYIWRVQEEVEDEYGDRYTEVVREGEAINLDMLIDKLGYEVHDGFGWKQDYLGTWFLSDDEYSPTTIFVKTAGERPLPKAELEQVQRELTPQWWGEEENPDMKTVAAQVVDFIMYHRHVRPTPFELREEFPFIPLHGAVRLLNALLEFGGPGGKSYAWAVEKTATILRRELKAQNPAGARISPSAKARWWKAQRDKVPLEGPPSAPPYPPGADSGAAISGSMRQKWWDYQKRKRQQNPSGPGGASRQLRALPVGQTLSINGKRVRRVDDSHWVISGTRYKLANATVAVQ